MATHGGILLKTDFFIQDIAYCQIKLEVHVIILKR